MIVFCCITWVSKVVMISSGSCCWCCCNGGGCDIGIAATDEVENVAVAVVVVAAADVIGGMLVCSMLGSVVRVAPFRRWMKWRVVWWLAASCIGSKLRRRRKSNIGSKLRGRISNISSKLRKEDAGTDSVDVEWR